jgi:hypothetical protein
MVAAVRDQHEAVAEDVAPAALAQVAGGLDRVHPLRTRRDEDVGRRPLLDLAGERRRAGIGDHHVVPGFGRPGRRHTVERAAQAGGGEDHHLAGRGCRRGEAERRQHRGDRPARKRH